MSAAVSHLGAAMLAALEDAAAAAAGAPVSLVSVTLDLTGKVIGADELSFPFETEIDRQTRTLVFLNARALCDGAPVMTGTAVFSIVS